MGFMSWYEWVLANLPKEAVARVEAGEVFEWTEEYGTIRKSFFEKTVEHEIHGDIDISVPVTILHGVQDDIVQFKKSIEIMEKLQSKDVELTYLKESGHRFQEPASLEVLKERVLKMVDKAGEN